MTVKDGKIAESNYNYVNAAGKLKTDDDEYQKTMSEKNGARSTRLRTCIKQSLR